MLLEPWLEPGFCRISYGRVSTKDDWGPWKDCVLRTVLRFLPLYYPVPSSITWEDYVPCWQEMLNNVLNAGVLFLKIFAKIKSTFLLIKVYNIPLMLYVPVIFTKNANWNPESEQCFFWPVYPLTWIATPLKMLDEVPSFCFSLGASLINCSSSLLTLAAM